MKRKDSIQMQNGSIEKKQVDSFFISFSGKQTGALILSHCATESLLFFKKCKISMGEN